MSAYYKIAPIIIGILFASIFVLYVFFYIIHKDIISLKEEGTKVIYLENKIYSGVVDQEIIKQIEDIHNFVNSSNICLEQ